MLKKAGKGIWEIVRQEDGSISIFIYGAKKDSAGVVERDSNNDMIRTSDYHGIVGHSPQEIYDALIYLFPELVNKEVVPADFDERVAAAIKRLAETDEDLIERIKNYTDGEST